MNCRLCRYQESNCHNCHNPKQTDGLKKFPIGNDRLNLRLKLSILSWLQLFVIRTISRKIRSLYEAVLFVAEDERIKDVGI
jgi:hypothetical protein